MTAEVELITIGDELLLGFTIDTNGAFIARRLAEEGIAIARRSAVGDSLAAIESAVREALDRTGAVITTGGLGPTEDDVTREAVAAAFGVALRIDEAHVEWMRERWRNRFGRDMPESNRRQAMMPAGARKLENRHGSAPGVFIEDARGRFAVLLPGVPRELRGMTIDTLLPVLRERYRDRSGAVIRSRTLRTTGVAESLLADRLRAVGALTGAALAYLPSVDGVDLRLTVRAPDGASADRRLDEISAALRDSCGDCVYGVDDDDLARVLLDRCRTHRARLAVAESCTGGMLGSRITAVPGSSDVFVGGIIAYANDIKTRELGVDESALRDHGAVSEPVVRQMAAGAIRRFNADCALAVTGIAGPDGGTPEKPVGLVWIAAAWRDRIDARKLQSWGDRYEIRYRATQAAMELARRMLT